MGQFEPRMIVNFDENKAYNEITYLHLKMKDQGKNAEYDLNTT